MAKRISTQTLGGVAVTVMIAANSCSRIGVTATTDCRCSLGRHRCARGGGFAVHGDVFSTFNFDGFERARFWREFEWRDAPPAKGTLSATFLRHLAPAVVFFVVRWQR